MNNNKETRNLMQKSLLDMDRLTFFLCMIWTKDILAEYVRAVFMRLPVLNANGGRTAVELIYLVVLLYAVPKIAKKQNAQTVFFFLIMAVMYLGTYCAFPANTEYLNDNILGFFTTVLPMVFLGAAMDIEKSIKPLYYVSFVTVVCAILYSVFISAPMDSVVSKYQGDMNLAYDLLPHLCMVGYFALLNKKLYDVILLGVGTVFLLSLGTRGALLCLLMFLAIMIFTFMRTKDRVLVVAGGAAGIGILAYGQNLRNVLLFLQKLFAELGLSIRIIDKIVNGELTNSSGRDEIRETLVEALKGHELYGYGLFGDRALANTYAHNIILEFWVHFGILAGSILLILLAVLVIRKFQVRLTQQKKVFLILLVCCSLMQLFLSSSYLVDAFFYLLIGICLKPETQKNEEEALPLGREQMQTLKNAG